jgi:hypothetical protein
MGGCCAEIILHCVNFIYFLAGIVIMALGITALVSPSTIVDLMSFIPAIKDLSLVVNLSGMSLGTAIYMTTAGSLVLVLSIIGCCGFGAGKKMKKRHGIVIFYGVATLLFILCDLALIVYVAVVPYAMQSSVESNMLTSLHDNFKPVTILGDGTIKLHNATDDAKAESANAWITMQFEQACCGVSNISDYSEDNFGSWNDGLLNPNALVPPSCCMQIEQNKVPENTNEFVNLANCYNSAPRYTNQQGCIDYVMREISKYNYALVATAAALTALQAIILCFVMGAMSEPLKKIGIV